MSNEKQLLWRLLRPQIKAQLKATSAVAIWRNSQTFKTKTTFLWRPIQFKKLLQSFLQTNLKDFKTTFAKKFEGHLILWLKWFSILFWLNIHSRNSAGPWITRTLLSRIETKNLKKFIILVFIFFEGAFQIEIGTAVPSYFFKSGQSMILNNFNWISLWNLN